MTHPVNLRRLLRDSADGGNLGCKMSVPSSGWNIARCCGRPLRSSAQLRGLRNPEFLCHFQICPVLTQATVSCEKWSNWHGNVSVSTCRGRSRIQKNLPVGHHRRRSRQRCAMCKNDFRFLCFWSQMAKTCNSCSPSRGLGRRVGSRHHALSRTQTVQFYR